MQIEKSEMKEFAELVATAVVKALGDVPFNVDKPAPKTERTAYQKTEQLLYNYMGFKKIVEERQLEIAELREFGVPQKCGGVTEYVQKGGMPCGIVLPEESVENAVRTVQESVRDTVRVIALIDKCMTALRFDPYYKVLEMRYFEGRTQEDIAVSFGCNQATIARNKSRLVKELAMRLFPDQVANEILS